jgi:hypothetical protein
VLPTDPIQILSSLLRHSRESGNPAETVALEEAGSPLSRG